MSFLPEVIYQDIRKAALRVYNWFKNRRLHGLVWVLLAFLMLLYVILDKRPEWYEKWAEYVFTESPQPDDNERQVLDEWVIFLGEYPTKEAAEATRPRIQEAYLQSGHARDWSDKMYVVRSVEPYTKGYYSIIIDASSKRGNEAVMRSGIRQVQATYTPHSRPDWLALKDKLGRWFDKAHPLNYTFERFEGNYGPINEQTRKAIEDYLNKCTPNLR